MHKWQLKEKRDALDFKGSRNKGSGNQWYRPGDILNDRFLIEVKQTDKKSYSLNRDKLDKIYEESLFSKKTPMMSIQIQDTEVIVLFKQDWLNICEVLEGVK